MHLQDQSGQKKIAGKGNTTRSNTVMKFNGKVVEDFKMLCRPDDLSEDMYVGLKEFVCSLYC